MLVYFIFLEICGFLIVSFFNVGDLLANANFFLNFFLITLNNFLARIIITLNIIKYYIILLYIQNKVFFQFQFIMLIFIYLLNIFILFIYHDFSFLNVLIFYLLYFDVFIYRFLFNNNATLWKFRSLFPRKSIDSFIFGLNQNL